MRRAVALAIALLLGGCGAKSQHHENQAGATEKVSAEVNSAPAAPPISLPPANAAARYVGTWATSAANCASKPWHFTKDALDAKDGPRCSIYNVAKDAGGYDLAAQCPTKVPVHTDLIKVRFAESAGAMLVESNAIPPTGLVYCGK